MTHLRRFTRHELELQFNRLFLIILLFMSYYGQTLRELNSYYFGHNEACYHYTKRSRFIFGAEALELHQLYPPYEGGSDTYLPPAIWHPRQDSNLQNTRGQSPQPLTIRPRGYVFWCKLIHTRKTRKIFIEVTFIFRKRAEQLQIIATLTK